MAPGDTWEPLHSSNPLSPLSLTVTDEDYEILSGLPDSVLYTCGPCAGATQPRWREALSGALQGGLRQVLQGLLSSKVAGPLLLCTQVWRTPEVEGGGVGLSPSPSDIPHLQCGQDGKQLHPGPCDLQAVGQRFEEGHYKSVVSGTWRGADGCHRQSWAGVEVWSKGSDTRKLPYSTASWKT